MARLLITIVWEGAELDDAALRRAVRDELTCRLPRLKHAGSSNSYEHLAGTSTLTGPVLLGTAP